MVQAFIVNLVIKQLLKTFNLNKIKDYVEKPNELDQKVKELEKRTIQLEAHAHPPVFTIQNRDSILERLKKLEMKK